MNTFEDAKRGISAAYDAACREARSENKIEGEQARKVLSILLDRQKEALTLLDSAEVSAEIAARPKARRAADNGTLRAVLYALLTALGVLSIFSRIAGVFTAIIALALLVSGVSAVNASGREGEEKPELTCRAEIPEAAQTAFSAHMSQALIRDTRDIVNLFSAGAVSAERKTEQDMAEMYQTIYFASAEDPALLKPVLDRQEQMLWSIGLEAAAYSENTANCFEIEEADCASQMICPAVRRKKDGSVVKRGTYIRGV